MPFLSAGKTQTKHLQHGPYLAHNWRRKHMTHVPTRTLHKENRLRQLSNDKPSTKGKTLHTHKPEVCVREHPIVVHQQRRALKLCQSRAREPRRPVLAKVKAKPHLAGTGIVRILHELFQDRRPFGVISEYLSDSDGKVDLLTEVLAWDWLPTEEVKE